MWPGEKRGKKLTNTKMRKTENLNFYLVSLYDDMMKTQDKASLLSSSFRPSLTMTILNRFHDNAI